MKNEWDVDAAIATYNVDGWGGGYFTVNPTGNVAVRPLQENGGTIDGPQPGQINWAPNRDRGTGGAHTSIRTER